MKLGDKMIGNNSPVFIIAEAGVNHNGRVDLAKRLIDAAKEAGCDAVKFQTFKADKLVSGRAEKAAYQKRNSGEKETQLQMLKKLELDKNAHREIIAYCKKKKITFVSTPFDAESADLLEGFNVPFYKLGSGEVTNLPFLKYAAQKGKPIVLSTGMSGLDEVRAAVKAIYSAGNKRLILLHCVTEYPAPCDQVNLRAMITLSKTFHVPVGYSDHTPGIEIAVAAAALGAPVIEKHFTLDRNMSGPDHQASVVPGELKQMVRQIRNVEKALGDGIKKAAACEVKNINIARKSLVAAKDIDRGERISIDAVAIKRPGRGIQPKDLRKVIGLRAKRKIKRDAVLTWGKLT